jgi:hypothetical protein
MIPTHHSSRCPARVLALTVLSVAQPAFAQTTPTEPAPAPAVAPQPAAFAPAQSSAAGAAGTDATPAAPAYAPAQTQEALPPPATWTSTYSTGQWVYTDDYGWIWVPNGTASFAADGVPYDYLYTPAYGWNWYLSPWGFGPYAYGRWVLHAWRPVGFRGSWVAHPSARLGAIHRVPAGHAVRMAPATGRGGGHRR